VPDGRVVIRSGSRVTGCCSRDSIKRPALPEDVKSRLTPAELTAFKKHWPRSKRKSGRARSQRNCPTAPEPVEEKPNEAPVLLHK